MLTTIPNLWRHRLAHVVLALVVFVIAIIVPFVAWAQGEPADSEAINPIVQWIFVGMGGLMTTLLAGIAWLVNLSKKKTEEGVKNEWVRGVILRLLSEVERFAGLMGTAFQGMVTKYTAPTSEGGAIITRGELRLMSLDFIEVLSKGYGGLPQLLDLLKRIGWGETDEEAKERLLNVVEPIVAKALVTKNPQLALAA